MRFDTKRARTSGLVVGALTAGMFLRACANSGAPVSFSTLALEALSVMIAITLTSMAVAYLVGGAIGGWLAARKQSATDVDCQGGAK